MNISGQSITVCLVYNIGNSCGDLVDINLFAGFRYLSLSIDMVPQGKQREFIPPDLKSLATAAHLAYHQHNWFCTIFYSVT